MPAAPVLSVLDLAPICRGGDAGTTLRNSLALAQEAERLGYRRYWVAEHHNIPGVASSAPAVVVGHLAAGTSRIRVGAGGVMLPNHAPLVVAEQFGTLAALYPGRIDLGLGRAPGTDPRTVHALRRTLAFERDGFPDDVRELLGYLGPARPGHPVRAIPGEGSEVPVWILGSSLFGAQLAARLGLPFAFASHFAPALLDEALHLYRAGFVPSATLREPHAMIGATVIVADTDAEAQLLLSSLEQAFVALRSGHPMRLEPPREGYRASLDPAAREMLDDALACACVGAPDTVERSLGALLARTGADEVMVTAQIFDHAARLRSYALLADVRDRLARRASVDSPARASALA